MHNVVVYAPLLSQIVFYKTSKQWLYFPKFVSQELLVLPLVAAAMPSALANSRLVMNVVGFTLLTENML